MIKSWTHDLVLAIQARSGFTPGLVVWLLLAGICALTTFSFLCVAGYVWISSQLGPLFAALIMAGIFLLFAVIALMIFAIMRQHTRERAILERAARAHSASGWMLDPKLVATAVQIGRSLGWQRLVPVALLGFIAAQWAREYRQHGGDKGQ